MSDKRIICSIISKKRRHKEHGSVGAIEWKCHYSQQCSPELRPNRVLIGDEQTANEMHLFPKAELTEWTAAHFSHTCDTLMLRVRERPIGRLRARAATHRTLTVSWQWRAPCVPVLPLHGRHGPWHSSSIFIHTWKEQMKTEEANDNEDR